MIKKLTDRIYYLEGNEFTDRPFLYLIKGDQRSAAVDAGASANHVSCFYRDLERTGLRVPDYTIITHWHWDHSFGMHAAAGKTIASRLTNDKLKEMQSWEWTEAAMEERLKSGEEIQFCADCMKREYAYLDDIIIDTADQVVEDEMILDLGNVTCRIIQHDNTHSRDGLFVYVPEEKVLAVGDADCEDYYDGDYKYDQERLKSLIAFISGFDFEYYLRGHDDVMNKKQAMEFLNSRK